MINATFVLNPEHFGDVYGEECVAAVRRHARVLGQAPMSASDFVASSPEWLDQVDVLFTGWGAPLLDSALLARMPRLRAVFYAAGTAKDRRDAKIEALETVREQERQMADGACGTAGR